MCTWLSKTCEQWSAGLYRISDGFKLFPKYNAIFYKYLHDDSNNNKQSNFIIKYRPRVYIWLVFRQTFINKADIVYLGI